MNQETADRISNFKEGFPFLSEKLKEPMVKRLERVMPNIAGFVAQGQIPNAELSSSRSYLNDFLKSGYDAQVKALLLNKPEETYPLSAEFLHFEEHLKGPLNDLYWDLSAELHLINSSIKKFDKILKLNPVLKEHPVNSAITEFFKEAKVLSDVGQFLKENAVKRQTLSAEEKEAKAKYVPPMADKAAQAMIHAVLSNIAQGSYESLKSMLTTLTQDSFQRALSKSEANPEFRSNNQEFSFMETMTLGRYARKDRRGEAYKPYPNMAAAMDNIATECERDAKDITESFVIKNLRKLASVVDRKGQQASLVSVEEIGRSLDVSRLEGELRFKFSDGSSFDINNQVVRVTNQNNTTFNRFPLTFHNIIPTSVEAKLEVKGNKPLAKRSEEWMNTVF